MHHQRKLSTTGRVVGSLVSIGTLVLVAALLGIGIARTPTARAAPLQQAVSQRAAIQPHVVFGPPQEGSKLTLGETSIGGPAFWAQPGATPQVILAWTGTDATHHVNVRTGTDGFHYPAKRILPETSPFRPAVTFSSGGRAGFIVVAWTGTDTAHTLNVEYLDAGTLATVRKLTFWDNTSLGGPGIAVFGGDLALAWTDKGQNLTMMRLSLQGQVLGKVQVGAGSTADESTTVTFDPGTGQLLLSSVQPFRFFSPLFFSTSTDAVTWTALRQIAEFSDFASSMLGIQATTMPTHWLGWTGTGTDTAHHLNVQYTEGFPNWPTDNSKTTFGETDLGAPALGFIGQPRQLLVAWTGTDAVYHLNIALIQV